MKMLEIIEQEQSVHLTTLSNDQKLKAKIVIEKLNFFQEQTVFENIEGDKVMKDKRINDNHIEVLVGDNAKIDGNFVVANSIKDSFNKIDSSDISNDLKELLKELSIAVNQMIEKLSEEESNEIKDDLDMLIEQSTQEKPKRKWWSVSVDGLTKAAENIGKVGQPVLDLLGKLLPIIEKISV